MSFPRPLELLHRRWPECLVVAGVLVLFWDVLFTRASIFMRDIGPYILPMRVWWRDRVLAGELPEWIPELGLGVPFLADPGNQSFYPPSVLLLLPLPESLDIFLVAHVLLAGLGALYLARVLGADRAGAAVAGATLGLGGYMVSMTTSCLYLCSAAYIPWVCLAMLRLRERPRVGGRIAALVGLLSMQILAGDFQAVVLGCCLGLVLAFALPGERPAGTPQWRSWLRLLLLLGLAGLTAVLIASVQLIPTLLYASETVRRDGVPIEIAQVFSTHPLRLLGLVVSEPMGNPVEGPYYGAGLEVGVKVLPWAFSLYCGAAAAVLVPLALTAGGRAQRRRAALLSALSGLVLLLALGAHTPLYEMAHRFVPLFAMFRYPEKLFSVVSLLVALLAGLGVSAACAAGDQAMRRWWLPSALVVAVVAAGALVLWRFAQDLSPTLESSDQSAEAARQAWVHLSGRLAMSGVLAAIVLVALVAKRRAVAVGCCVVDLLVAGMAIHHGGDLSAATPAPEIQRLASEDRRARSPLRLYDWRGEFQGSRAVLAERGNILTAAPNRGVAAGVGHLTPYSAALPNSAATLLDVGEGFRAQLCDVYSVDAVMTDAARYGSGPFRDRAPMAGWGPLVLLENPGGLPRARVLGAAAIARDESHALSLILGGRFPLDRVALLVGDRPAGLPRLADDEEPPPQRACRIHRYEPELVSMTCRADGPSVALLADQHIPGWSLELDGSPAPILRTQFAARGAVLSEGEHHLVYRYRTPGLLTGVLCSCVGSVLLGIIFVIGRRR